MTEKLAPLKSGNPAPDAGWLALRSEAAIEPNLPIIDAHHHLWDEPYRYLFHEYLADLNSGHRVLATVYVDCLSMYRADGPAEWRRVGEVEFANGIAAMSASGAYGPARVNAAIVGNCDLRLGADVGPILKALRAAGGGRFRGIRQVGARDAAVRLGAPEGLMRDRAFQDGFRVLQDEGLTFDAWLYHPQLGDLIDLLQAYPHARVALNHAGGRIGVGPYAGSEAPVNAWQASLAQIARFPNVTVKLGGLGMAMCGFGFHERAQPPTSDDLAERWKPPIDTVIAMFGPERCMFESNFPVDKASCSYVTLWNAFKKVTAGLNANDRLRLFHDTAARFYSLPLAGVGGAA